MEFYEEYKLLISTEINHKDNTTCALVTGIDVCTQKQATSVEFDYQKVYDREDTYHDVVGFFHTHPSGMNRMSGIDIETMNQWVKCLGKDLMCVIQTDKTISGWIFSKNNNGTIIRDVQVSTGNDVNYDICFDTASGFWHAKDFLIAGKIDTDELEKDENTLMPIANDIFNLLNEIKENQDKLFGGFVTLTKTVQSIMKENKDE